MKIAKLAVVFLAAVLLLSAANPAAALAAPGPAALTAPRLEGPALDSVEISSFLNLLFSRQLEDYHLAGIVAAVVKDGAVVYQEGFGKSDLARQSPVDPASTLFRIGSTTKLFTWTAVLQLYEQGRLDLEADVNQYLDFHIPDTFPTPITLKHLMSHTAGFEERAYEALVLPSGQVPALGEFLAAHIPARLYPPGEVSIYSDYGADLAGYIVERVSGMPYADYVEANILTPLGMAHTTPRQPLPAHLAESMSNGYQYNGRDLQPVEFGLMSAQASGDIRSTAEDMARFMIAILQDGSLCPAERASSNASCGSILQPATAQLMQSALWAPDERVAGYTYGFMQLDLNGQRILHHGGDAAGFHTLLMLLPEQNLGFFVSYNTTSPGFGWINALYEFMDYFYPPGPAANRTATGLTYLAEFFTGGYYPARSAFTTIEKVSELLNWTEITSSGDGALLIGSPLSSQKAHLEQVETMLFREASSGSLVLFQNDSQGNPAYLYDAIFPFASLVKVPWHANPILHIGLVGACAAVFLFVLLAGIIGGIARLFRRSSRPAQPALARLAGGVSLLVALLDLAGLAAFLAIAVFSDGFILMITYGQMTTINIILAAWLAGAVLTILLAVLAVAAGAKKYWSAAGRVKYTFVTAAALAFVWWLNYWNLLGFRY